MIERSKLVKISIYLGIAIVFFLLGQIFGFIQGVHKSAEVVHEYSKTHFCMEVPFAEQVMSCFVGNQSSCLNVSVVEREILFTCNTTLQANSTYILQNNLDNATIQNITGQVIDTCRRVE